MIFDRRLARLCMTLVACAAMFPADNAGGEPLPQSPQELTKNRTGIRPAGDAFGARSWAPAPKKAKKPVSEPVVTPPPQPPALPYGYGGSGVLNGKAILFLEQKHRSVMVARGDVVDGAYRVEALEPNRALLRFLPLDVVQVLPFGAAGAAAFPAMASAPAYAQAPLYLQVPDQLLLGRERTVPVGIVPGSPASNATIELTYDAEVLSVRGAKILHPGKAVVEVSATQVPSANSLRVKPIVEEGLQTEIGIHVTAFDGQGKKLEVHGIPAVHVISLIDERS
jgi:hypothetical protein